ncbi:hypothetical protein F5884DRAFT_747937 [Xylogone sp. PMI_703]|nr:hypothetical protein F5884DRAFT_747937 [Xylogone sp. PMI_703]
MASSEGPLRGSSKPLLMMRKGTKSCVECRRRKTKCTFAEKHPSKCAECYARGTTCTDQARILAHSSRIHRNSSRYSRDVTEQTSAAYSLRERVARLEDFIESHMKNGNSSISGSPVDKPSVIPPHDYNPRSNSTTDEKFEDSPVLNLFNNQFMTQIKHSETSTLLYEQQKSNFGFARQKLLSILPPETDLNSIIDLSIEWWSSSIWKFPEICSNCTSASLKSEFVRKLNLHNPAEAAKAFLGLLICAERLPLGLLLPASISTFRSQCLQLIDSVVVFNDDVTRTVPGIECLVLLSRYHANKGRLRKAWHLCRRALEYAIGSGFNYARSMEQPSHQTRLWQSVCYQDRYLSFLLGLPYGTPNLRKRVFTQQSQHLDPIYQHLSLILGKIVERNQDSCEDLLLTIEIDQELSKLTKEIDKLVSCEGINPEQKHERIELSFVESFIRALLHLPIMLNFPHQGIHKLSYDAAVDSAHQALLKYKLLRVDVGLDSYICTMIDFQAFTMAALLILHLLDQNSETFCLENENNWELAKETTNILRKASEDDQSIVAKQAVNVLDMLLRARGGEGPCPYEFDRGKWCKVTIPCFGEITIMPGKTMPGCTSSCKVSISSLQLLAENHRSENSVNPYEMGVVPSANDQEAILESDIIAQTFARQAMTDPWIWPGTDIDSSLLQGWEMDFFESEIHSDLS